MPKKAAIVLILERVTLFGLGLILFLRLFLSRVFPTLSINSSIQTALINTDILDITISFFIVVVFFIFLFKLLLNKEAFPKTYLDLPLILFAIVATASIIYSVDRYLTLKESLILVSNLSAFYMLAGLLNSSYRIKVFIAVLISAGLSVSLLGLIQYFFVYKVILKDFAPYILSAVSEHMINLRRIGSVFGWPNVLAGFLTLILPLAFVYGFTVVNKRERYYAAAVALIIFLAMLFTYSITAWTSLIAAALISGGLMLKVKRIRLPRLTIFVTIIFLVLVALIIISKRRTPFTAYSLTSRIMFIKSALLMIKEKPFLGYGFGTFGAVNPNYIPAPEGFSRYAHNSYLQIWAETGIAGFLLFFAVIGLILKKAFEGLRNLRNKEEQLILIGLFCGILAFLLDNINSFTMLIANVSLFWWVVIAIMFAWVRKIF